MTESISVVFDLITRYAQQQGWMPIGWRTFEVGPWEIQVNGTKEQVGTVPPYHALIAHRDLMAMMLFSPFGGTVGGWQGAEDAFITDMEHALAGEGSDV